MPQRKTITEHVRDCSRELSRHAARLSFLLSLEGTGEGHKANMAKNLAEKRVKLKRLEAAVAVPLDIRDRERTFREIARVEEEIGLLEEVAKP